MRELVILGGGPAAVSAGIYAGRKKMDTLIIAHDFNGQSVVSDKIENWIGIKEISGFDLAKSLEEHLRSQEGIEIVEGEKGEIIERIDGGFSVKTSSGKIIEARSALIATGGRHRRLNVPGEDKFDGKGVVFCSTCDAPLFRNKEVVVVGGGNAGLEAAIDLIPYASKISIIVRTDKVKGDPQTLDMVKASDKVSIIYNATTKEIMGDGFVSGIKYTDTASGEEKELAVQGVFVEVGTVPNSDMVKGIVELDEKGQIKIDCRTGRSSVLGIWAAGDVSDAPYKQNNIAAGDGIKAVLNVYDWLRNGK
jgi:alkyl hydroperoxide reductase subunit F